MRGPWFDDLARRLGGGMDRRKVLVSGMAGIAAAVGGTSRIAATARQATPVAEPGSTDPASAAFLFVQIATGGTWAPKPGDPETYLLTLTGTATQTILFSDRPAHIVGTISTSNLLDTLGFTPANPPNAAVLTRTGDGEDILVVELFNPVLDEASATLTYEARILADYSGDRLAHLTRRQDDLTFPASFGEVSLFIDDARCQHRARVECVYQTYSSVQQTYSDLEECFVGDGLGDWLCLPCEGAPGGDASNLNAYWNDKCNADVPDCEDNCYAEIYGG